MIIYIHTYICIYIYIIIGAGAALPGVALPPWNDRPLVVEGPPKRDKKVYICMYTYIYVYIYMYIYIHIYICI
jgi:hypothetical protein